MKINPKKRLKIYLTNGGDIYCLFTDGYLTGTERERFRLQAEELARKMATDTRYKKKFRICCLLPGPVRHLRGFYAKRKKLLWFRPGNAQILGYRGHKWLKEVYLTILPIYFPAYVPQDLQAIYSFRGEYGEVRKVVRRMLAERDKRREDAGE